MKESATRVEEIEPGIWLYSDGLKRYHGHPEKHNGSMAPGNPKPEWLKDFTPETSKLAVRAKEAKHLEAKEAIELELMKKFKTKSGALAIGKVAGSLLKAADNEKHPLHARATTFKTVATAGGYLQERSGATQAVQFNLTLSDEVVRSLVADGAKVVVEGEFVDIERKDI